MKNFKKYSPFVYFFGGMDSGAEKAPEASDETPKEDKDKEQPGIEKDQGQKAVGSAMAGLEGYEQLGDKPKVSQTEKLKPSEIKEMSKGYPEVNTRGSKEKAIIKDIVASIKADSRYGKIEHRDKRALIDTNLTDNYEYVLIYDVHHNPKERIFKSPSKKKVERSKEDPTPVVDEFLKPGYKELSKKDKYYSSAMRLKSKVRNHGDAQSYYPTEADDPLVVLLKDDNAKDKGGYRVFEGKPVA